MGTGDPETRLSSVGNQELSEIPSVKLRVGQMIALFTLRTVMNSAP